MQKVAQYGGKRINNILDIEKVEINTNKVNLVGTDTTKLLEVKDYGKGIPKEEQSKLFSKYGKTSSESTSNEVSHGFKAKYSETNLRGIRRKSNF